MGTTKRSKELCFFHLAQFLSLGIVLQEKTPSW